jgi:probable HAF family extracellular repeat protein
MKLLHHVPVNLNCRHCFLLTAVFFSMAITSSVSAIEYSVIDLGTLGGTRSTVSGINSHDVAIGDSYLPGNEVRHAFSYSGGVMTDLGAPTTCGSFSFSSAGGINNAEKITGEACESGRTQVFVDQNGVMEMLGIFGSGQAINNAGHVVGAVDTTPTGPQHAFLYSGGVTHDLGVPAGYTDSRALGVNDRDQVVGVASDNSGGNGDHGFLYSKGVMTVVTPTTGRALAINDKGQVVGDYADPSGLMHGFIYQDGVIRDIGTLNLGGDNRSHALSINNKGQIVGSSDSFPPGDIPIVHAFIFENGVMTDLNSLIPADSGWILGEATAINDKGSIVGTGTIGQQSHAFMLVRKKSK